MCQVGSGLRRGKKSKRSIKQAARGEGTGARGWRLDALRAGFGRPGRARLWPPVGGPGRGESVRIPTTRGRARAGVSGEGGSERASGRAGERARERGCLFEVVWASLGVLLLLLFVLRRRRCESVRGCVWGCDVSVGGVSAWWALCAEHWKCETCRLSLSVSSWKLRFK